MLLLLLLAAPLASSLVLPTIIRLERDPHTRSLKWEMIFFH